MAYGDFLIINNSTKKIYRYSNGSLDSGIAIPSSELLPSGIAVDPINGDTLLIGRTNNKVYRYSNGSWDSGFAGPSAEDEPTGLAIDPSTNDILLAGRSTVKIYRYSNGSWDSGTAGPFGETQIEGIAVDPITGSWFIIALLNEAIYRGTLSSSGSRNWRGVYPLPETDPRGITFDITTGNLIVIAGNFPSLLYRYSNRSWDFSTNLNAPGRSRPSGIAFDSFHNINQTTDYGDILLAGKETSKVYRYSNGSWDSGLAIPYVEIFMTGVAVDPTTGDIVIVGKTKNSVYRYSNGSWDFGIRAPAAESQVRGVTFDPTTNDILIIGLDTNSIYRYSNGSWDSGLVLPSTISNPLDIAVNPITGDIYITTLTPRGISKYSNGSWVLETVGPAVDNVNPGLTFDPITNDIVVTGSATGKVYRYSNGSWDSGFAGPVGETDPFGITFNTFGTPPEVRFKENINIVDSIEVIDIIDIHNRENIVIAESIDIQVVYGSEVTQQEFELLSKWYVAESFTKTWLIPEDERPTINTNLTPSGENRELVKVEVTIFGTLVLNLSSDVTGSVTQGGDDLSSRFESEGHAKVNASNHSVIFSVADSLDFEEPYVLENRIPGNALFNALSTVNKRQNGKLTISDGDIVEKYIKEINEPINIHEAIFIGADNFVKDIEEISINEEVNIHILKNFSEDIGILENIILDANKHISENISIQDAINIQLVRKISKNIPENISIQDAINIQSIRKISKNIPENIRIQDRIVNLIFDPNFDLSRFNKVGLDIFALALITSGTPQNDGTIYRHIDNQGPLGSASADSDLEIVTDQSITRIALEIQGAGNIRLWDNPSGLHFSTFTNDNPTVTLRVQFSSAGPAYELTRERQGGNFSSWSTTNSDARTAIHNARVKGQRFILALASPVLDLNTDLAEQISIADLINIKPIGRVNISEQISIADLVKTKLAKNISKNIPENINIVENISININKPVFEQINIADLVKTELARNISNIILEQINVLDNIILGINKSYSEGISIQDEIATLTFEPDFDLDRFNKVGLDIFALALITSGTPEGNGTIYRHIDNGGPLGSVSTDSDLEVTNDRDITRIALEIQGVGNIRLWDNPGTLFWGTFFAANPTATVRVQFSSAGPAYELTRGNQGSNFSNWSTTNSDARTAIHNARAEGQKFILALASPGLNLDADLAEQINVQDAINIKPIGRININEQINIADLVKIKLAIDKDIIEQISIQDLINIQLAKDIRKAVQENISIQDLINIQLARVINKDIVEQINIQDAINIKPIGRVDLAEQINIQDAINIKPIGRVDLAEQIRIQDLINTKLIIPIGKTIQENIRIRDLINTRLIRDIGKVIQESIRIRDAVSTKVIIPILKTIRDSIRIQDVVDTRLSRTAFWPQALPNELSRVGYAESPTDNVSRFKTTYGSGSRRPRYTSTPILYTGTILLTPIQYAVFRSFYFDTLKAGSKDFIFPNLLLSQSAFVRFTSKPNRRREGKNWRVTLQLRTI